MNATEIALSESQERMAVVIDARDLDRFMGEAVRKTWRPLWLPG